MKKKTTQKQFNRSLLASLLGFASGMLITQFPMLVPTLIGIAITLGVFYYASLMLKFIIDKIIGE